MWGCRWGLQQMKQKQKKVSKFVVILIKGSCRCDPKRRKKQIYTGGKELEG